MALTAPQDKPVALVTGGARGIGAAICEMLAERGYLVVVVDVDETGAKQVAEAVGGSAVEADVSDLGHNHAMVARAVELYGQLDLVVLNAGISSGQLPGRPIDLELYRRANGVNLDGVVFGIDAAVPVLSGRGGSIVVMASLASLAPEESNAVYALGKSAVMGYVRAMASTLAQHQITINAICPSLADTRILGLVGRFLVRQGFPLLAPAQVASAVGLVLDQGGTGEAWALVAGRPPYRHEFAGIATTLMPDGTPAIMKTLPPMAPDR